MSADTTITPAIVVTGGDSAVGPLDNRFHVVAVACQRVIQIRGGARPRLDPQGHKPCFQAVAEVVAGAVPYYLS